MSTDQQTDSSESYSWYELRAIYAHDHGSGATIEQLAEGTARTDASELELKQLVADATGRVAHEISDLEVIERSVRDHVEDSAIVRTGRIQLGGIQ